MRFSLDFKKEVYVLVQHSPLVVPIMDALEKNHTVLFRRRLEEYMDSIRENIKPREIIDDGDRILWNGLVAHYNNVCKVYSNFMEEYVKEIDKGWTIHENINL